MVNVASVINADVVNAAVNDAIKTWIADCLGREKDTADSSLDHATAVSIGIMAAAEKSASFSPAHDLLSTTNADHHYNPRHRSSLGGSDCGICPLIIACEGTATVVDYFFRDSHHYSTAVAADDKKMTWSAHRMAGALVEGKIDAIAGTSGHTSTIVNFLGLDWSAFRLSETRLYHHFRSFLYPRSDADTIVVNACCHTASSADGRLDVPHDSDPNGVFASEDTIEASSFDSAVVGFVSKSYPFAVAQLGSPDNLTGAYREASARLDSRYFVACDSYPIVAFRCLWEQRSSTSLAYRCRKSC